MTERQRTTNSKWNFRKGMQVYTSDNQTLGSIDELHGDGFHVQGQHYPGTAVSRVDADRVYLTGTRNEYMSTGRTGLRGTETEGAMRVPVVEERLDVEKRQAELGAVEVRKHVTQEQVNVPVELTREEVRVERVDVADRPVRAGDLDNAFQEGTIRVPVRGEEAVVEKQAYVTGEVVINKERTTERQTISDTVRKEHVDVDENWRRARGDFEQHFANRQRQASGTTTTRSFTDVEPHYRTGFEAGYDQRYSGKSWNEVEPHVRRDYETRTTTTSSTGGGMSGSGASRSGGTMSTGGRSWEDVREEVREGFERVNR